MITDTQADTLLYRGNRYQLINIQICQPTHTGYSNLNKTLVAEIVLTYTKNISDTYPGAILAIFPIYEYSLPDHNAYLQQFIDSNSKPVSAQSLFYDSDGDATATSYNYKCCVQLQNPQKPTETYVVNTAISYFPRGTTLLPERIQAFKNLMANHNPNQPNYGIMPFEFLPFQRNNYNTYLAADQWDVAGGLPSQQVSPTDDGFVKRVQYMTQPPLKSNAAADTCPYKKVSDYKCYPFNELNNITNDASGNKVVIPLADAMNDSKGGSDGSGGSMNWIYIILYIVVPTIILVGLVIMVAFSLLVTNQMSNPGLPLDAAQKAISAKIVSKIAK